MKLTSKNFFDFIILSIITISISSQAASRKQEKVKLPIQLKPERMKVLNRIADEKIVDEQYPYRSVNEVAEIIKRIDIEKEITSGESQKSSIQKLYRTLSVSMTPSDKFQTISLVPNFSTTIVFVDKIGNPWAINKYIVGGAEYYHPELQSDNIITFTPKVSTGSSNLTVMFKGGKLPVSFNLLINKKKVDYIIEVKVDGYGNNSPKEKDITFINTKKQSDSLLYLSKREEFYMSEMLSGNLPSGFKELDVLNSNGGDKDGYRVFHKSGEKFMFIKTIHEIYSPRVVKQRIGVDQVTKVMRIPYTTKVYSTEFGNLEKLIIKNQ